MKLFKTDRSLVLYIILTMLTCGIYGIVFMYCMIDDINEMLRGDGKHTHNIFMVMLLSLITLGIYSFIWYYDIGERLGEATRVRNIPDTVSGTSVLLWILLGSFLCGVGPYVALYQIINATNKLAVYNNAMVQARMAPPPMR